MPIYYCRSLGSPQNVSSQTESLYMCESDCPSTGLWGSVRVSTASGHVTCNNTSVYLPLFIIFFNSDLPTTP